MGCDLLYNHNGQAPIQWRTTCIKKNPRLLSEVYYPQELRKNCIAFSVSTQAHVKDMLNILIFHCQAQCSSRPNIINLHPAPSLKCLIPGVHKYQILGTYPRRTYASLTCSNQCWLLIILLILAPNLEIIGQDVLSILIFHCQAQFLPTDATEFYLNQKYKLTSKNPLRNTFVKVSLEAKNIIFINTSSISKS